MIVCISQNLSGLSGPSKRNQNLMEKADMHHKPSERQVVVVLEPKEVLVE
jgi:hypothetical protein